MRLIVFFLSGVYCFPCMTIAGDDQPTWNGAGSPADAQKSHSEYRWSGDRWGTPAPSTPARQPQMQSKETASAPKDHSSAGSPQQPKREVETRQWQQLHQRHREQAKASIPRLTAWQLQNPSGSQNRSPTGFTPSGFLAPNTYFGPAHREWNQLTGPVTLTQMPFNYRAEPTVLYANVPLAPPTYLGRAQADWSQVRTFSASPHAFGGWNVGP